MTLSEIQSKINSAKALDFGDVISQCIDLFKKFWVQGLLTIIIIAVITVPIALISQFILGILGVATERAIQFEDFSMEKLYGLFGINSLYNAPFTIITAFFQILILGAFYRIIKLKDVENSTSEDYFYFFKSEYFVKALMLAVIHTGIGLISQFLCFIPYIYAVVPLMYFSVIFAFNSENSVEDIVKASFLIGNKKWLLTFGSLFVCGILGMLGVIACVIGVIFTISIAYFPSYVIYKEVVGFDGTDEIDEIGTNL